MALDCITYLLIKEYLVHSQYLYVRSREGGIVTRIPTCPTHGTSSGHWATKACVCFCWVPSHCGIKGNEIVDQLAKDTLDHDIDPLTTVHYADLKPLVMSYIQQDVQTKWDVSIRGRDLYLVKQTLEPPKKFQHLTRAEQVVITWLRIRHPKATKSHILSRGPPTTCQHYGQTLTINKHMLLECTVFQQSHDEYYTADSLGTVFETTPEICIVEFLREAAFLCLIWIAICPAQLLPKSPCVTGGLIVFGPSLMPPLPSSGKPLKLISSNHTWLIYGCRKFFFAPISVTLCQGH